MGRSNGQAAILLTGGSGYIGTLIAATLIQKTDHVVIIPVRQGHDRQSVIASIRCEIGTQGGELAPDQEQRIHVISLAKNPLHKSSTWREIGEISEVIHCAGCLDYFDTETLETVNVEATRTLIEAARSWGVDRFTYLSTAFSSGYSETLILEKVHLNEAKDPTEYTRTKRQAERLVASSGLPYLIVRPPIVIGDSRDGHYSGKTYGLYQLWNAAERVLLRKWHRELHLVASNYGLHMIHQDDFQRGFFAAFTGLPKNSIINLVADETYLPSSKDIWTLVIESILIPEYVYMHETFGTVPLRSIDLQQRAFLAFASVNIEISCRSWRFETTNLNSLVEQGFRMPMTTLDTVARCWRNYMERSDKLRNYRPQRQGSKAVQYVDARNARASVGEGEEV